MCVVAGGLQDELQFCMTGKQGFKRSLSSAEIINQILSVEYSDKLTNLVFMGMGNRLIISTR